MSDLDNAINSINASAAKAENTATFLDDMSTFDNQSSVTNPNNGQTVASIPKQVKDRTDELFTAAESDINQAVADAEQSATDAQEAAGQVAQDKQDVQGIIDSVTAEADRSETYAEVAMASGWVYATVAAGEAARVDGNYFWVVSAGDSEVLELWLMGATTATDTGKRTPSTEYVKDGGNINPKTLRAESTDFADKIVTSENLFNKNSVYEGYNLNNSTGELKVEAGKSTSQYITVETGERYRTNYAVRFHQYDENRDFIVSINSTQDATVSSTTKYIRIAADSINIDDLAIAKGSSIPSYSEYTFKTEIKNLYVSKDQSQDIVSKSSVSATNEAENGNFVDDSGYLFGADVAYSVANNKMTITNLSSSAFEVYRTLTTTAGHIYYVSVDMLSDSASDALYTSNPTILKYHGGSNKTERLSIRTEAESTDIAVRLLNTGRSGDISANPIDLSNFFFVDLTESFGAGNEPTLEYFESLLDFYGEWFYGFQPLITDTLLFDAIQDLKGPDNPDNPDVRWCAMGDSITEGSLEYPHRANVYLNYSLTNQGFGGSSMAMRSNENESFNPESFVFKAKNTINWADYDVVTIFYGTNDWSNNVPIGAAGNVDEYTYTGALNVGLQAIYSQNPTIKIILATPTFRRNTLANTNDLGLHLQDYVDAVKERALIYRTQVIDLWGMSGWNYYTNEAYTYDGLHPNEDGQVMLGKIFIKEMDYLSKI